MISQGKIIEYVEHGKFICAAVISDSGKRLRLLNQNGREVNLPAARVVHCSEKSIAANASRQELLDRLQEVATARQAIELPVPLEEVWQLASEDMAQTFTPRFLTELCFSDDSSDNQEAAFLRHIFRDRIFFKYKDGKINAHSPEAVTQLQEKAEKERRRELLLQRGADGIVRLHQGETDYQWPERQQCLQLLADYYVAGKEAEDFETARLLIKKAGLTGPHDIFHLMVKTGLWHKDENIGLKRYQVDQDFSAESLAQAAQIQPPDEGVLENGDRKDLRHLPLLTIDGPGTKDFDDALHVEKKGDNFLVGVHIADVSHSIKPGSPLFKTAMERVSSIYFADATVPMLPKSLSENALSLLKDQDRAALSFLVELNSEGEVVDKKIVPSLVRVKEQLTYQEAEERSGSHEQLPALIMLSRKLRSQRIKAGALILPIPDVAFTISDEQVEVRLLDVENTMRVLVAEFMVLANWLAAEFIAVRQEPGLFRSQGPPQKRLYSEPDSEDLYLCYRQRRHLARGNLSGNPRRHHGVGVEQYTTVTSPIRRLLDLIMQSQIRAILQGDGALFTDSDLKDVSSRMESGQSRVNLVSQLRHRYWLLRYLEPRQGEFVEAFILARNPNRVKIVLTDCLLEGELPPSQGVAAGPGDTIMVKVAKVNVLDNVLRLEW